MNKLTVLCCVISFIVMFFIYDSNKENQYGQDFIYIYEKILSEYPFLNHEEEERIKDSKKLYLEQSNKCQSDIEFVKLANEFLSQLNSIHTVVHSREDSYAIYNTYKKAVDNNPEYTKAFKSFFREFEKKDVLAKYKNVGKSNNESFYNFYSSDNNFIYYPIINNKIAYFRINNFFYSNIESDFNKIQESLNETKNYKIIVIDLRNNCGGDTRYFTEMFLPLLIKDNYEMQYYSLRRRKPKGKIEEVRRNDELSNLIKKRFDGSFEYILNKNKYYTEESIRVTKSENSIEYNGELYLLVDGYTASSAAYFAAFVKDRKLGTIVGECTAPESIGSDSKLHILPNTKLLFRINDELIISRNLSFKKNGMATNGCVSPDIEVKSNYDKNERNNQLLSDPCIKYILSLERVKAI